MKTKIFTVLGFILLVFGVTLIVHSTSLNDSLGVSRSFADIYFYNSEEGHEYNPNVITSSAYPLEKIYMRAKATLSPNPPATPVTITVNNITTYSH